MGNVPDSIRAMLCTTTPTIPGKTITLCFGLVAGEAVLGGNVVRDLVASIRDTTGGRVGTSESLLSQAREAAVREMCERARAVGAHAVVGVRITIETLGNSGSMLLAQAIGTAVCTALDEQAFVVEPDQAERYIVQIGGAEKGPFSLAQLRELVSAGRLTAASLCRREDGTDWQSCEQVVESV